ncbi:phospholipase A and acyltransferase 3-like [Engraulis encrasicolus]|uniref:phospholipase A and acyltransferase 3-like n=1 Tax=Engraulis encrasicolus TaxID=184585 RepID=UPI002FD54F78
MESKILPYPTKYDQRKEMGDLTEIFRGPYQHWAVYVGDGYVIHLAPDCEQPGAGVNSIMSLSHDRARVKREKLLKVVGNDDDDGWQVNNLLDEDYEPRSPEEIAVRAESMVGRLLPYSVFERNCEHFVTNLRYGKPESRQVRTAAEAALVGGVAAVAVLGVTAAATALFLAGRKERESRR